MKIELFPEKDYRTQLPITLSISQIKNAKECPQVEISSMGKIGLKKTGIETYSGEFWFQLPGTYQVKVFHPTNHPSTHKLIWSKTLFVEEQVFLPFHQEFGFFLVLFFLAMGGLILWMSKKLKKK